jgi:2'-5' RNA ligase
MSVDRPATGADNQRRGSGWPDRPGDTALTIRVPEAHPLVRTAAPAHITVLYPFVPLTRIATGVGRELAELLSRHDAFELTFAQFRRYPGVLYLDPQPHQPLAALTADVRLRWPEAVPYRGIFGDEGLDPHLTVANDEGPDTWESAYDALEAELAPRLPLTAPVREVLLIVWDGTAWRDHAAFPLRPTHPPGTATAQTPPPPRAVHEHPAARSCRCEGAAGGRP